MVRSPTYFFDLDRNAHLRSDKNTLNAFGFEEYEQGYLHRYGFEESVHDGATMPLHFEPRLLEMHIDQGGN